MFVISYDIEDNRIRNKIAKTLEDYGRRVQYSVFECDLNEKRYKQLYSRLAKLMRKNEKEGGSIRFYRICANCEAKIVTLGVKELPRTFSKEEVIII